MSHDKRFTLLENKMSELAFMMAKIGKKVPSALEQDKLSDQSHIEQQLGELYTLILSEKS